MRRGISIIGSFRLSVRNGLCRVSGLVLISSLAFELCYSKAFTTMTKANSSFKDEKAGLHKVNQGRYAMIMDRINLEYYAAENCSYMLLGEALTQVRTKLGSCLTRGLFRLRRCTLGRMTTGF